MGYFIKVLWMQFRVKNGSPCDVKVCSPVSDLCDHQNQISESNHLLEAKPLRLHHHGFVEILCPWIFSWSWHPNFGVFILLALADTAQHCHNFFERQLWCLVFSWQSKFRSWHTHWGEPCCICWLLRTLSTEQLTSCCILQVFNHMVWVNNDIGQEARVYCPRGPSLNGGKDAGKPLLGPPPGEENETQPLRHNFAGRTHRYLS